MRQWWIVGSYGDKKCVLNFFDREIFFLACHLCRPYGICRCLCPRPRGQDYLGPQRLRVRARSPAPALLLRSPRPAQWRRPGAIRPPPLRRDKARTHHPACLLGQHHHPCRCPPIGRHRLLGTLLRLHPQRLGRHQRP